MNMIRATPDLEGHLPTDLSLIIERPTLIRLAFEAVEATPWPASEFIVVAQTTGSREKS